MDVLSYLLFAYFAFAFTKFMLCAQQLPTAIGVISRLHGAKPGKILIRFAVIVPVFLVLTVLFGWIGSLYKEGPKFFSFYSTFTIIRTCIKAYRDSHD
jgi:hypothetical protein